MTARRDEAGRFEEARRLDEAIDAYLGLGQAQDEVTAAPELVATARLLAEVMPRFHPRFAFEERLAQRLAGGDPWTSKQPPSALSGPRVIPTLDPGPDSPSRATHEAPRARPWRDRGALLRGGALASGVALASGMSIALPLAGAALVRRRRARAASRPSGVV